MIKSLLHLIRKITQRLTHQQLLMISAVLVGLVSGLLAVVLKSLAHYIQAMLLDNAYGSLFLSVLPVMGILLTLLIVAFLFRGKLEKGSYQVLYAIAKKNSRISRQQTVSHVLTSAITVGLGGSAGLESPIVQTGSAVGANLSGIAGLGYKDRTLLIGCGAAAGIAAAFNAPIAGVLFALEVLLAQVSMSVFIPIIMAGATGALCSKIVLNEDILLSFRLQQPFNYHNTHYYIFLGIFCGLYSVYYVRMYLRAEKILKPFSNIWMKAIVAGFLIGFLILFFPPLFGEGYGSIRQLADQHPEQVMTGGILSPYLQTSWHLLLFLLLILLGKVFATAFTISGGGNGGNFAPSLFSGAILGYAFVLLLNQISIDQTPAANFTLAGMCGVLTGVFHAPLTGIFLIAEITGGYDLIIPLMIVSATSLSVSRYLQPKSLDAMKLAEKGHEHSYDQDANVLNTMTLTHLLETDFAIVRDSDTLGDLVKLISQSRRNTFPVVDANDRLKGIIQLDDVRDKIFETNLYQETKVQELMQSATEVIDIQDKMTTVMERFDRTKAWNLPVVSNQCYIGFISKSKIFTEYRKRLQDHSLDF